MDDKAPKYGASPAMVTLPLVRAENKKRTAKLAARMTPPFIDNKRGATMEYASHKAALYAAYRDGVDPPVLRFFDPLKRHPELGHEAKIERFEAWLKKQYPYKAATPKPFWQSRITWLIAACVAVALFLTACASPHNHPGIPRTPDPAYEGWGE